MYLAQRFVDGCLHYLISHSYQENGWWRNVDLLDLGADPARFVIRTDQGGFGVEAQLGAELRERGYDCPPAELEELFLPFVPEHLREVRKRWWQRGRRRRRRVNPAKQKRLEAQIPFFDRRRLCYLHTGAPDLAAINILPIESFLPLADKSRDEIEQFFLPLEQQLDPAGHRRYLFAIFNLQHWFFYLEGRSMPPELDCRYLDQIFMEELCRINADCRFWMQDDPPPRLHPYLIRYATMFFDSEWDWDTFREDGSGWFWGRGPGARGVEEDEADALFGANMGELRAMSRKELAHLYKRRALQFHPDRGGDPEKFVLLTRAYEALLKERGL